MLRLWELLGGRTAVVNCIGVEIQLHKERGYKEWLDWQSMMMAKTLGTSISRGFEMPKRDYLTFDGNPIKYPRFIENFRVIIEERDQILKLDWHML